MAHVQEAKQIDGREAALDQAVSQPSSHQGMSPAAHTGAASSMLRSVSGLLGGTALSIPTKLMSSSIHIIELINQSTNYVFTIQAIDQAMLPLTIEGNQPTDAPLDCRTQLNN
jgi:hypothetical protein